MPVHSEHDRMVARLPEVLSGLLGVRPAEVEVRTGEAGADLVAAVAGRTFVVEFRQSTGAAPVAAAAAQVRGLARRCGQRVVPLLAVPYMGDAGRRACQEAGVGWVDLSGNAHLVAPGLRVVVEGKPNRFRAAGRPPNLFAPKSSRVVRWLLMHPGAAFTQRQIARATDMTEGFVSRIVARLEREGYLVRDARGAIQPQDPELLLDAWRAAYDFSRHTLHPGHVPARSGEALLESVIAALAEHGIGAAATGLAAAWVLTHFAAFQIATLYLPADPPAALLAGLGYRADARGANLWLVLPNDAGVFQGAVERDGIRCVHPVQVYVDLKGHPERAPEAAERLRAKLWPRSTEG